MNHDVMCAYVTMPDQEVAEYIARKVIDDHLTACANVFNRLTSFFRWNDEVNVAKESILIIKSNQAQIDVLKARIDALHPYDCPCIVSWLVQDGAPEFWTGFVKAVRRL